MTDNMQLWDAVSKTDPNHTKQVNQRGGFTAIDAHYQVQEATRAFGPIGKGWGYTSGAPIFGPDNLLLIPVTLWHGNRSNEFGPQYGSAILAKGGRVDVDAPKKATTDAITKLLSHLGFNADVFLGKFDDNKYFSERKREVDVDQEWGARPKGQKPTKTDLDRIVKDLTRMIEGCGDRNQLDHCVLMEEYKEGKALLEKYRPSALYGPSPQSMPEFVPIKELAARKVAMFKMDAETNNPTALDAG